MRIALYPADEPANHRRWRPWFAWRPVMIDNTIVWLETVERRHAGIYPPTFVCPFDYRLKSQEGPPPHG